MIFEPIKLSKIIEQNYTHLMPDFFKMQTEYLASLKMIYNDLDASLIAMLLTSEFYKNIVRNNDNGNYSLKNFYRSKNYETPISVFKICSGDKLNISITIALMLLPCADIAILFPCKT